MRNSINLISREGYRALLTRAFSKSASFAYKYQRDIAISIVQPSDRRLEQQARNAGAAKHRGSVIEPTSWSSRGQFM